MTTELEPKIKDITTLAHMIDVEIGFHCHEQAGFGYSVEQRKKYKIKDGSTLDSAITAVRECLEQEIKLDYTNNPETIIAGDIGWGDYGFTLRNLFTQELDLDTEIGNLTFQGILTAINLRVESKRIITAGGGKRQLREAVLENLRKIGTSEERFYADHILFGLFIPPWTLLNEGNISEENAIFVNNLKEIQRRIHSQIDNERVEGKADTLCALLQGIREIDANGLGENIAIATKLDLNELDELIKIVRVGFQKSGLNPNSKIIEIFKNGCGKTISHSRHLDFLEKYIFSNLGYEANYSTEKAYRLLQYLSQEFTFHLPAITNTLSHSGKYTILTKDSELYSIVGVSQVEVSLSETGSVPFTVTFNNGHKFASELDPNLLINTNWVKDFSQAFKTSEISTILLASILIATVLDLPLNIKRSEKRKSLNAFLGHSNIQNVKSNDWKGYDKVDAVTAEVTHDAHYVSVGEHKIKLTDDVINGTSKSYVANLIARLLIEIIPDRNKKYR